MSSVSMPCSRSTAYSSSPKSPPTGPTTRTSLKKDAASEKWTAEPPSVRSRSPKGVFTASKAIDPTTTTLMRPRRLADNRHMTAVYVVLGVLALLALWSVLAYNGLVKSRNKVDEAWSGIDVQLKRRHDLVPNLVESVKGYAAHENEIQAARRISNSNVEHYNTRTQQFPTVLIAGSMSFAPRQFFEVETP